MRALRLAAFAALILGMLPVSGALAADYGASYGYPPPPVEIGSGWYLRGDVGLRLYAAPSMTETSGPTALTGTSAGWAGSVSGGFGYEFNDRFRGDVTVDYALQSPFTGTLVGACAGTDDCAHRINVSTASAMANVYFDLVDIGGFTPYVGAGVGVSMVTTSGNSASNITTPGAAITYPGATQYNLAWALMAGASWALSPETLIDLGFRLSSLGGGATGTVPATAGGDGTGIITIGNIIAPEIRLGMRYKID